MNKKTMQDITPPHRRSIRDIPLSHQETEVVKKSSRKKVVEPVDDVVVEGGLMTDGYGNIVDTEDYHRSYTSPNFNWGKIGAWIFVIALCIGGFLFGSSFFHSAIVEVKVKEVDAQISSDIKMSRTANSGVLPFEIVSLNKEASQTIPAQGEKQVSVKASGKVVIYNKNTVAQKLLAQTRLESLNGKIYRTANTVTIPASKKSGTSVIPGSIEVKVVADAPGADYNSDLTDFTLPGFKGTAKYETVYARSKTPISDGASGTVKVADPNNVVKAQDTLKQTLQQQLLESVNQQKPDSFILFANLYSIRYASSTQESKGDSVLIKQKADMVGVLVNSKTLASFLAPQIIRGYSGEELYISNLNELTFTPSIATSTLNADTAQLSVKIEGKPHFIYIYDSAKLSKDLVGMSRESFPTVLATYPGLEKGSVAIKPFWKTRFPTDFNKIIINEEK